MEIHNVKFIEAIAGELLTNVAKRARKAEVNFFVHNDTLYKVLAFEKVGTVEVSKTRSILETSNVDIKSNESVCGEFHPEKPLVTCLAAKGHYHVHFGFPEMSVISPASLVVWARK